MKKVQAIVFVIAALLLGVVIVSASSESVLYMPLVFKSGVYYDTPTPTVTPSPTVTRTPRPTPLPPTPTPTYQWAEGGNTCAYVWAARDNPWGEGMITYAQVPSVCSILEIVRWEQGHTLLIVKAKRIKTDTYGCMRDDFGPLVEWPPTDDVCPPPELPPPSDEWGRILWGDIEEFYTIDNAKKVCGYCEECLPPPLTLNCVDTVK